MMALLALDALSQEKPGETLWIDHSVIRFTSGVI